MQYTVKVHEESQRNKRYHITAVKLMLYTTGISEVGPGTTVPRNGPAGSSMYMY